MFIELLLTFLTVCISLACCSLQHASPVCYNSSAVFALRDLNTRGQELLARMRAHTSRLQQQADAMLAFASACETLPALLHLGPMRDTAEGTEVALHSFFAETRSFPAVQAMELAAKQAAESHALAAAGGDGAAVGYEMGPSASGFPMDMAGASGLDGDLAAASSHTDANSHIDEDR